MEPAKLLLLPGVLCNQSLWEDTPVKLSKYFAVEKIDILQGQHLEEMIENVIDKLTEPHWIIGFSLGGWLALEVAKKHPELVQGLILISTSGGVITPQIREAMQHAIEQLQKPNMKSFIETSLPLYLTPEHAENPDICEKMTTMMMSVGAKTGQHQYQAMLDLTKPFDYLNKIKCPSLVIRGEHEQRNPLEVHQKLADSIPHGYLDIIKNAAHFVPLEQPHLLLTEIIKFISENSHSPLK